MIRKIMIFILTALTCTHVFGQKVVDCDCTKTAFAGTKVDTTFYLANGTTIVLCGSRNTVSKPATYSEFVLRACALDSIIGFWSADLTCSLRVNSDTLLIDQLVDLPTGESFSNRVNTWSTEKIYLKGERLMRKLLVNRKIRKYTEAEIQTVLKSYELAKPGLDDNKMGIANKLFIATISGNKIARQCFNDFKTKFGTLDGAFNEEYNNLTVMLASWDKAN